VYLLLSAGMLLFGSAQRRGALRNLALGGGGGDTGPR